MTDKKIIESYRKMKKIKSICNENKIDHGNLISGKTTAQNEKIVADEIVKEIVNIIEEFYRERDNKDEKVTDPLHKRENKERKS